MLLNVSIEQTEPKLSDSCFFGSLCRGGPSFSERFDLEHQHDGDCYDNDWDAIVIPPYTRILVQVLEAPDVVASKFVLIPVDPIDLLESSVMFALIVEEVTVVVEDSGIAEGDGASKVVPAAPPNALWSLQIRRAMHPRIDFLTGSNSSHRSARSRLRAIPRLVRLHSGRSYASHIHF